MAQKPHVGSNEPLLAVLRPEPGNAATAARIAAAGAQALRLPLFEVRPLAWTVPDPAAYDALVLTSANAVRQAGAGLAAFRELPVYTVGAATAAAAEAAGLRVVGRGEAGARALAELARRHGVARALHLAGRDRATEALPGVGGTIAVYASEAVTVPATRLAELAGCVALIHSPRAGARLAALVTARTGVAVAAISEAAANALGGGWAGIAVAARPDDTSLIASALALAREAPIDRD